MCWYISQNVCFNFISSEQRSFLDDGKYIIAIFHGGLKAREDELTVCACHTHSQGHINLEKTTKPRVSFNTP